MRGVPPKAWVVVADGEKALLLQNVGEPDHPHLQVLRKREQDNPANREQRTDAPGRRHDGPGVHRSAMEETDWHRLAKERFASDLAEILYKRAHAHAFEKLILVAGPDVLGALRRELHSEVARRVIAVVPKQLTSIPIDSLETRLSEALSAGGGD